MINAVFEERKVFNSALDIQKQIDLLQDRLHDLRITGGVSSSKIALAPSTKPRLSTADMVGEIESNIETLENKKTIQTNRIKQRIEKHRLTDREKQLLVNRYVRCLPWKQVRALLGLSEAHTHRLDHNIMEKMNATGGGK